MLMVVWVGFYLVALVTGSALLRKQGPRRGLISAAQDRALEVITSSQLCSFFNR